MVGFGSRRFGFPNLLLLSFWGDRDELPRVRMFLNPANGPVDASEGRHIGRYQGIGFGAFWARIGSLDVMNATP